jgi:HPt (histidine-containing phosphotransfer) domain-containing protein
MTPQLQEIVECDPGMISDLFSLFVEDSAARLRILSCACTNGDFKIVRAQAHSLKGSSLQIGAAGLGSLCAALELSNRSEPEMCGSPVGIESVGTESVGIESIMRAIDDEFVLVRRAIEGYLVVQGGTK